LSARTPAGQESYDLLRGDDPAEVEAARKRIAALVESTPRRGTTIRATLPRAALS